MEPWKEKATRVIESLCLESYRQANTKPDGTRYKKHRPYAVPDLAERLVECIRNDDEIGAKQIFVWEV